MDYMRQALSLARQALGTTSPNPAVGAVIVKNGSVVGAGHTQPPGSAHAEVMALRQAGEAARDATMYVTLEPCAHQGRTPPCTAAIIAAGVSEVHMAMIDPNPIVSGRGKAQLEAAGIKTYLGEGEEEASEIVESYVKYITTGLPFVTAKYAMSLDGKIATRTGDSKWITGAEARQYVQRLRSVSDAILVGVNTVLADDPRLTVRDAEDRARPRQPLRVIVDSKGRTPPLARMFAEPGKTIVVTGSKADAAAIKGLAGVGGEVLQVASKRGLIDLAELLSVLGQRQINSVLVEGGGEVMGYLFDHRLVDKVYAFIAPVIVGGREAVTAVAGRGVERMSQAPRLSPVQVERLGDDVLISGYPEHPGD
ncbi:MAG: bifunctional diaminohydroxyphosphoribosylaminopyrimidine deaminase/5-amino-6-(5-phosphoribosylamino)uracil reductase RibD [Dehalococcoidia bacterium]|nr:bifunctional diaminohydroxyphosphoribosylaminopyrimidine deaminase/5-amino-6-(5-phosphoribosylamino)uracil reductase RibD [Dehalococcoidia bacterium]